MTEDQIETTEPLNKKDITSELTDFSFDGDDFDDIPGNTAEHADLSQSDNAIVEIMDMLIQSSGTMFKEYGYPEPNLKVWASFAKPNLTKALNAYMPVETTGNENPMFAAVIGICGLVMVFLPIILKHIDNHDTASPLSTARSDETPAPVQHTDGAAYEVTQPVNVTSTAPISDHTLAALERLEQA